MRRSEVYFAPDFERVVEQARLSSLITHTHPEAVAVGAAPGGWGAEEHQHLSPSI
ncbi:ADP-ribosylglycohydrolase family protein [Deinococcus sp. QL22]|uniref:ADP-ribosylglycohydrolase family protein n=1 Tax=Deinococcus sp. QL22 TaxID=2939437 RepID=UPI002016BEDF|nr:ADP-ribosylglycohydrolase family protein [Deinococcus sp. QL22]UQN06498.1 ADP-ribosylglycohydrolase family protein [Deinococcus sp. QL22]